ncbi:DUF3581 family protein [Pseudoalteromonas sp. MMG024]|uniref:DUF3581 family protein n=1 Tax=Pseudoalteromonas sp. MMG024 TaxID=2909980 RepID=UPI001F3D8A88|nr:DUF3581 family protein [Pseudoalteromonas sp. MMG024]MCF6457789.1 DUF3581 domain-containing protein [Pseudoalteromonas sp. MMG024]
MLSGFYQESEGKVSFTRDQASRFAKLIADDYNPLHDIDAKRFCVPGDLLFSMVLNKYGVSEKMHFTFAGMVDEKVSLTFPDADSDIALTQDEKVYLSVNREGDTSTCEELTNSLIKNYVEFSGKAFPHVIIPLMGEQEVMINPARPMVMYESMSIEFSSLDVKQPVLEFVTPEFELIGKRGKITLPFVFKDGDKVIGKGEKNMLVSGIREYCQKTVDELIAYYNQRKVDLKPA